VVAVPAGRHSPATGPLPAGTPDRPEAGDTASPANRQT
jgi:hypothetical protein